MSRPDDAVGSPAPRPRAGQVRSGPPVTGMTPSTLRLPWRSTVALLIASAIGILAFGWPLLAPASAPLTYIDDAPLLFALMLPLLLAVVLAEIADGGIDAKTIAMLGVLAAVGAALRPLGTGVAGIEPIFFLLVLAGRAYGPGFGFVLGGTTLFASALITAGVGPWLPFQMFAAAWISAGAGLLPRAKGWREVVLLTGYGAAIGLLYGLAMNLSFWPFTVGGQTAISFVAGDPVTDNLRRFIAFAAVTSLGFDIPRAILTATLVAVTGRPILRALRRAGRRAAFAAPIQMSATERQVSGVDPVQDGQR